MKVSLPTTIGSAIATMNWSLTPNSNPMYYESLPSLLQLRQKSKIESPFLSDVIQNLHETIDYLASNQATSARGNHINIEEKKHYIAISLALICLGNGLGDEAHALVTPLSWGEETYFGGPSISSKATEEVVSLASYVHALVHRREGFAMGEFGMMGYQNANYWSSATISYQNGNLPFEEVRNQVLLLGEEFGDDAMKWCQENIELDNDDETHWESRALHELCARTSRDTNVGDTTLRLFAEKAAEAELKVLLQCSLRRAGFEIDDMTGNTKQSTSQELELPIVDENVAQAIANKVSSAHLGAFQSSNSVTIRNLFQNADEGFRFSVASGLACRLLNSPACLCIDTWSQRQLNDGSANPAIQIVLPKDETEVQFHDRDTSSKIYNAFAGGPLSIGDAFASITTFEERKRKSGQLLHTRGVFTFLPCDDSKNEAIIFRDKFYGSRGETPTSVVQWSKGTIFKTDSLQSE